MGNRNSAERKLSGETAHLSTARISWKISPRFSPFLKSSNETYRRYSFWFSIFKSAREWKKTLDEFEQNFLEKVSLKRPPKNVCQMDEGCLQSHRLSDHNWQFYREHILRFINEMSNSRFRKYVALVLEASEPPWTAATLPERTAKLQVRRNSRRLNGFLAGFSGRARNRASPKQRRSSGGAVSSKYVQWCFLNWLWIRTTSDIWYQERYVMREMLSISMRCEYLTLKFRSVLYAYAINSLKIFYKLVRLCRLYFRERCTDVDENNLDAHSMKNCRYFKNSFNFVKQLQLPSIAKCGISTLSTLWVCFLQR